MNRIEFDNLVARIESSHRGRTQALQTRALWMAILGYAILALAAALAVAAVAVGVMVLIRVPKLGILLIIWAGAMLYGLARAIWVRTGDPVGVTVGREDAPRLFALIDEVGEAAGGVRVDRVFLTPEYNAAVQLNPRLGIFGWCKRNLILGLPLLDSLSASEFKSVLAHELEHLGRRHGRIGTWIYRTRTTWASLAENLISGGSSSLFLKPFFSWFWPRFNATAFVLSRGHEYEADAFAAQNSSAAVAGAALLRIELNGRRLQDDFWPAQMLRVRHEESPPADLYERMGEFLRTEPDSATLDSRIRQSLSVTTGTGDTHPSLKDRLAAFGDPRGVRYTPVEGTCATEAYLPEAYATTVRAGFSREWAAEIDAAWRRNHPQARALAELERDAESESGVDEPTLWKRCEDAFGLTGLDSAQFWVTRLLERNPRHPGAMLLRGQWLALRDDDACIPLLESAAKHAEVTEPALSALAILHDRRGEANRVHELRSRADSHDARMERFHKELGALAGQKTFGPHDYDAVKLETLRELVRRHPVIRRAWLARRPLASMPERNAYVLVLSIRYPWYKIVSEEAPVKLCEEVVAGLPDNDDILQVIPEKGALSAVAKRVKAVPSALAYERAR